MTIRTVECVDCGGRRPGRRVDDETIPFSLDCPACGGREFVDVVDELR